MTQKRLNTLNFKRHDRLRLKSGRVVWFIRYPKTDLGEKISDMAIVTSSESGLFQISLHDVAEILPSSAV